MKPADIPLAHPLVMLREGFDDCAVLFHPFTGEAIGTGSVGVAIWKALDGRRSLEEIAAYIKDRFEDAPDSTLADTIEFLDDLYRKMLVTLDPALDEKCPKHP